MENNRAFGYLALSRITTGRENAHLGQTADGQPSMAGFLNNSTTISNVIDRVPDANGGVGYNLSGFTVKEEKNS